MRSLRDLRLAPTGRPASRLAQSLALSILALLGLNGAATAAEPEPQWVTTLPQIPLPKDIMEATPLLLPESITMPDDDLPGDRDVVHYELSTGSEFITPAGDPPAILPDDPADPGEEIYGDPAGIPSESGALEKYNYLISGTTAFPWRTIAKVYTRFGNSWRTCSAFVAGPFHVLTTGACAHNGTQWSDELVVYPGQTDVLQPYGTAEHPFGEARATWFRSYSAWINNQNLKHNFALVTLDRALGYRVGWLARSSNVSLVSAHRGGYPNGGGGYPYILSGNLHLYDKYTYANILDVTTNRIRMSHSVLGGTEGGAVWQVHGGPIDIAVGINSDNHSPTSPGCFATRLTDGKRSDIDDWITQDQASNAPADRPDLQAYNTQRFVTGLASPGQPFSIEFSLINVGYASSGPITVDFFLNDIKDFDGSEHYAGSRTLNPLDPMNTYQFIQTLQVPAAIPPGSYYLGWRIDGGAVPEYATWNNAGWNWSGLGLPISVAIPTCGVLASGDASGAAAALAVGSCFGTIFIGLAAWRRRLR